MIPAVLPTYSRAPLPFVKGEGSWLIETDGRRFLDMGAGIAVNVLGHAHPALVAALTHKALRAVARCDDLLFQHGSTGAAAWADSVAASVAASVVAPAVAPAAEDDRAGKKEQGREAG